MRLSLLPVMHARIRAWGMACGAGSELVSVVLSPRPTMVIKSASRMRSSMLAMLSPTAEVMTEKMVSLRQDLRV